MEKMSALIRRLSAAPKKLETSLLLPPADLVLCCDNRGQKTKLDPFSRVLYTSKSDLFETSTCKLANALYEKDQAGIHKLLKNLVSRLRPIIGNY